MNAEKEFSPDDEHPADGDEDGGNLHQREKEKKRN